MNRRAFLTALSAIPAVALFPALLRAEPDPVNLDRLAAMYAAVHAWDENPDAFFVNPKVAERLAQAFNRKPAWGEFESPWGGDICGTPSLQEDEVQVVVCRKGQKDHRTAIYVFSWDKDEAERLTPGHKQAFKIWGPHETVEGGVTQTSFTPKPITGFKLLHG